MKKSFCPTDSESVTKFVSVPLKDLTDAEVRLLLPGTIRTQALKATLDKLHGPTVQKLTVPMSTLRKLEVHLRRDVEETRPAELARIFIDITTDWPYYHCSFTIYREAVVVEWAGQR